MRLKYIFTISALVLALINYFSPTKLDPVTLVLLGLAVLPWLAPMFKSIELPGGLKVEYRELEKVKEDAAKAGLIGSDDKVESEKHSLISIIAQEDLNLALAALRVEIERRLRAIAEKNGLNGNNRSLRWLMDQLVKREALSQAEYSVLTDMIGTLNDAVHGAEVSYAAAGWIVDVGLQVLSSLDKRISSS